MDPKANGQLQEEWKWLKAVYLFLGGVGGGAYAIAAVNGLRGAEMELVKTVGLWIAFPAVLIGTIFLTAALGTPSRAVLAAKKQKTSWISRGTLILTGFMAVAFFHLVLDRFTDVGGTGMNILAIAGIVLAVGTMAYTGILLGASKGIPFWRTGAVPVVFLTSALLAGHFAIMLGITLMGESAAASEILKAMAMGGILLIAIEVLAVVFFLQAARTQPDSRESADRLMRKPSFIVGYLILGVAAPLALMWMAWRAGADGMPAAVAIGAVLGLAGRLIMRQGLLICGAFPTLSMAGFEFRRIHRPKQPKPGIGMLPPQ